MVRLGWRGHRRRSGRRSAALLLAVALSALGCGLVVLCPVPDGLLDDVYLRVSPPTLRRCLNASLHLLAIHAETEPFVLDLSQSSATLALARRLRLACARALLPPPAPPVAPDRLACFAPRLPAAARLLLRRHLRALRMALDSAAVEYFLDMGSALGSRRHFGFIPYDEDVDFRLNAEHKERAAAQLARLGEHPASQLLFHDTAWRLGHWKVYASDVRDASGLPFAFDIFFYERRGSVIVVPEPPFEFNTSDVFPLRLRPFEGLLLPTPSRVESVLQGYFPGSKDDECLFYSHENASAVPDGPGAEQKRRKLRLCQFQAVPCEALSQRYPFVRRVTAPGLGELEYLMEGDRVVQVAFLPRHDEGHIAQGSATQFQGSSEDWSCDGTQVGECLQSDAEDPLPEHYAA